MLNLQFWHTVIIHIIFLKSIMVFNVQIIKLLYLKKGLWESMKKWTFLTCTRSLAPNLGLGVLFGLVSNRPIWHLAKIKPNSNISEIKIKTLLKAHASFLQMGPFWVVQYGSWGPILLEEGQSLHPETHQHLQSSLHGPLPYRQHH